MAPPAAILEGHVAADATAMDAFPPPTNYNTAELIRFHFDVSDKVQIPPASSGPEPEVSGPQGSVKPYTVIEDPAAWKAADYAHDESKWVYQLTDQDVQELSAAVAGVDRVADADLHEITQKDFPLPTLGLKLAAIGDEVTFGKGFHLIRGFPVQRYTRKQMVLAYLGIGTYWGEFKPQNVKGHMITHIKDLGLSGSKFEARPYTLNTAQPIHNDAVDLVGLLCLGTGVEGGLSGWCSAISVHNELLRRGRKDLVEGLAEGRWLMPRKGFNQAHHTKGAGLDAYYEQPIFNYHDGYLSVDFNGPFHYKSQANPAVPRYSAKQNEAMAVLTALARSDELMIRYKLQPGEIQLLHNVDIFHTRTAFQDGPEPGQQRHMLRLWITKPGDRPLPPTFHNLQRSGWHVDDGNRLHVPLEPEHGD